MMTDPRSVSAEIPFNEAGAERVVSNIDAPILKNAVQFSLAKARMRFIREAGEDEYAWRTQLPAAPFDMGFFASVLKEVFSRPEVVERILRGESIEQATGWDV